MVREQIKTSRIILCPKEEPLPGTAKGPWDLKKIPQEQEVVKKCSVEGTPLWSQPSMKTDETRVGEQSALHKEEHIRKHLKDIVPYPLHMEEPIRKHLKDIVREQLENSEFIIYPKEALPPDDPGRAVYIKAEEKNSGLWNVPHFRSFEHRLSALRATAHLEPPPAACTGDTGDTGGLDKTQKAERVLPLDLSLQKEHPKGLPHTDPEPAPGHCTGDTMDPADNAYLDLDSCLLAQVAAAVTFQFFK